MDIAISRKTLQSLLITLALLCLMGTGVYLAWQNNLLERFLPQRELQGTEPALGAVTAFFAPNIENGYETWLAQVCAGMSEDGCGLLRDMYGKTVWQALETSGAKFLQASATLLEDVETLENGHHIWELSVEVCFLDPQGVEQTNPMQTYAQVSFDKGSKTWRLERVLFDQEIEQRYGGQS
jgi:hypothetical protein